MLYCKLRCIVTPIQCDNPPKSVSCQTYILNNWLHSDREHFGSSDTSFLMVGKQIIFPKSNISSFRPHFHKLDHARDHHISGGTIPSSEVQRPWPFFCFASHLYHFHIFAAIYTVRQALPERVARTDMGTVGHCAFACLCAVAFCYVEYEYVAPCGMWCGRQLSPLFWSYLTDDRWLKLAICTTVLLCTAKICWVSGFFTSKSTVLSQINCYFRFWCY